MFGCRSIYPEGWRAECGWPGPDYATGAKHGHHLGDEIHQADLDALENRWQLFNLTDDPAEKTNVIDDNPEVGERLKTQLEQIIEAGRSRP